MNNGASQFHERQKEAKHYFYPSNNVRLAEGLVIIPTFNEIENIEAIIKNGF